MNIIDRIKVEQTKNRFPVRSAPKTTLVCEQTDLNEIGGLAYKFEFSMRLAVEVKFHANKAEYHGGAREAATRALLHTLYGDALAQIDSARHAIYNDDIEGALSILGHLRDELTGRSAS